MEQLKALRRKNSLLVKLQGVAVTPSNTAAAAFVDTLLAISGALGQETFQHLKTLKLLLPESLGEVSGLLVILRDQR